MKVCDYADGSENAPEYEIAPPLHTFREIHLAVPARRTPEKSPSRYQCRHKIPEQSLLHRRKRLAAADVGKPHQHRHHRKPESADDNAGNTLAEGSLCAADHCKTFRIP
jgi:hypothetical protein